MWRNIWFLARGELKSYPVPMLLTGLFFAFMGVMTGELIREGVDSAGDSEIGRFIQLYVNDFGVLALVSILGFAFTKECFGYHRTDFYSKKLAFYRKLPIRNEEIVAARYIVMLVCLPVMSLLYFTALYFSSDKLDQQVTVWQFIGAAVIWLSLSLFLGGLFIYFELGMTGKQYLMFNYMMLIVYGIGLFLLGLMDVRIIGGAVYLVKHYAAFPPIAAIMAGAGSLLMWSRWTVRRLAARDLV